MCVCVCSDAVPERGELGEADRLYVDVSLPVEPSSSVPQLDGVDLTQGHGVSQHRPVHRGICRTAANTQSTHGNNRQKWFPLTDVIWRHHFQLT